MSAQPNAGYKVKIIDCKFFVRKVKLLSSVFEAHARAMETGNAKYPIRRAVCKTFTIPQGNLDFSQEQLFSGTIPSRLVLAIVDNDAFNGNYEKNPFHFKHYNLTHLKVTLDGQQQNYTRPIEPNYEARQYIDAYMSLFSGTGKQQKDEGTDITREVYSQGYAIYAFDLTPDMSEDSHFNLTKEGSVRVDFRFAQALPNTVNIVAYGEFEQMIEIDRNKQIIYDFTS